MNVTHTDRGFELIRHPMYGSMQDARIVMQSSAIRGYTDSFDKPGSSCLWFGEHHLLNREEVAELVEHLQAWLATGSLERKTTATPPQPVFVSHSSSRSQQRPE